MVNKVVYLTSNKICQTPTQWITSVFKLMQHSHALRDKPPGEQWLTVDRNCALAVLLERYEMLSFTEAELLAAQMLVKKNSVWRRPESSRVYCLKQATLITEYADDAIERVASQIIEIIEPSKFVDIEYGLPSWIRRLTLAFVSELGISI